MAVALAVFLGGWRGGGYLGGVRGVLRVPVGVALIMLMCSAMPPTAAKPAVHPYHGENDHGVEDPIPVCLPQLTHPVCPQSIALAAIITHIVSAGLPRDGY